MGMKDLVDEVALLCGCYGRGCHPLISFWPLASEGARDTPREAMRGARLPRQAGAFSGGPKEYSAFCAEDCFGETRNPEGVRFSERSRTRAVRRAAAKTRSSVRAMEEHGPEIGDEIGKR